MHAEINSSWSPRLIAWSDAHLGGIHGESAVKRRANACSDRLNLNQQVWGAGCSDLKINYHPKREGIIFQASFFRVKLRGCRCFLQFLFVCRSHFRWAMNWDWPQQRDFLTLDGIRVTKLPMEFWWILELIRRRSWFLLWYLQLFQLNWWGRTEKWPHFVISCVFWPDHVTFDSSVGKVSLFLFW